MAGRRQRRAAEFPEIVLDHSVRRYAAGRVLLGGSPLRLVRLSVDGARRVDRWLVGAPVDADAGSAMLLQHLLSAGLVHPVPGPATYTAADVTLVVPVKDNAAGLSRLLDATCELRHRIVVDDGSEIALGQATIRHHTPHGPAAARNTGWRRVRTDLVAFLDSDVVPEADWLDAVLPLFDDPRVAAVAPRVRSRTECLPGEPAPPGAKSVSRYEEGRSSLDMGRHPAVVRPMSRVAYVPTAALVVRRDALAQIGGFDERLRFGEDVDLVWRLADAGHLVRYQPSAVTWHTPRRSVWAWLRQRFDYGTSAAPLAIRHPERLACARLSPLHALSWASAVTGRPSLAASAAAVAAALTLRRLRGIPATAALAVTGRAHIGAGHTLADAVRRAWWPVALLTPTGRRVLLLSLGVCLAEAVGGRHGTAWLTLRIADDAAYSLGVWTGCLRHRTLVPLSPRFTGRRRNDESP
ncbi:mycofactocin biosynthesis glycosyltransferase MftF [Nocardia asiatica]|uniref:mycofactocin biosynthesis glycosyltransferase MftF n=1 Tax=Nocardia asiatica TaxID=209252 RepID=UPI000307245D|nr:mycofactocin biosynthesis glycosyltransferase MftF [Nocardia asiatica]